MQRNSNSMSFETVLNSLFFSFLSWSDAKFASVVGLETKFGVIGKLI